MKHPIFTKIIATLVLIWACTTATVTAQSTLPHSYSKTVTYKFENKTNEFLLYGVGKVILKNSGSQTIRCDVKITGYGKTQVDAQNRANDIVIKSQKNGNSSPKLFVNMGRGRYNKRYHNVVTTVYLPSTVTFQHNEDIDIMEYVYRIIDKFR